MYGMTHIYFILKRFSRSVNCKKKCIGLWILFYLLCANPVAGTCFPPYWTRYSACWADWSERHTDRNAVASSIETDERQPPKIQNLFYFIMTRTSQPQNRSTYSIFKCPTYIFYLNLHGWTDIELALCPFSRKKMGQKHTTVLSSLSHNDYNKKMFTEFVI